MNLKTRMIIAGACLALCLVLVSLGHNHWIQNIGTIAAGFIFGSMINLKENYSPVKKTSDVEQRETPLKQKHDP